MISPGFPVVLHVVVNFRHRHYDNSKCYGRAGKPSAQRIALALDLGDPYSRGGGSAMNTSQAEAVRVLDNLIAGRREKLDEAKKIADTIPALVADLAALERARALAAGNGHATEVPSAAETTEPSHKTGMVLEALRTAGRALTVDQIMTAVTAREPSAKRMTILGHLSRFAEKGRVRRTAPGIYEFVK